MVIIKNTSTVTLLRGLFPFLFPVLSVLLFSLILLSSPTLAVPCSLHSLVLFYPTLFSHSICSLFSLSSCSLSSYSLLPLSLFPVLSVLLFSLTFKGLLCAALIMKSTKVKNPRCIPRIKPIMRAYWPPIALQLLPGQYSLLRKLAASCIVCDKAEPAIRTILHDALNGQYVDFVGHARSTTWGEGFATWTGSVRDFEIF